MCAENTSMNYHWNESDISEWFKTNIEVELVRRKYQIVKTDIYVKICARMNSLGLVYTINIDALKNNRNCILENFNTTSKYNDGLDSFPWFMDFFKEKEAEAILKFSNNVLDLGFDPRKEFVGVKNIQAEEKKYGEVEYETNINCSNQEMVDFLTSREMINNWNRGVAYEGDLIKMENIQLEIISVEQNRIEMRFKLNNWKDYSKVEINLSTIRNNTKIVLKQTGIPLNEVSVIKRLWRERIFMPICMAFGFSEINQ
ncbi:hypothetical protein NGRA_1298 [Nosema granulosis]|uniref:Uncharacterized protein n=1 Tax=Nosema granulosis TaxID=83296 RepID=A0A9P6KZI0_9MICR|nr:hypothetical protein NGRA_1298 [Nosema granulosis]